MNFGARGGAFRGFSGGPGFRGAMGPRTFGRPAFRGGMYGGAVRGNRAFVGQRGLRGNRAFVGQRAVRGNRAVVGQRALRGNRNIAARRALQANRAVAGNRANWRANRGLARQAGWHRNRYYHRHYGHSFWRYAWLGPLFWPFAYDDLFYYTFWPAWYGDPFWDYGYIAIYDGIFAPGYYTDGPRYVGPRRQVARRTGVTDDASRDSDVTGSVAPGCGVEGRSLAAFPIDRLRQALNPTEQQRPLLDDLASASTKASETVRAACPAEAALTPPGRLDVMEKRVEAMIKAVEIVRPPLENFYNALNDEQKARFNAMGEQSPQRPSARDPRGAPRADLGSCSSDVPGLGWPADQVDRVVRPTEDQRTSLNALAAAAEQAASNVKAACPTEMPKTPVGRLEAASKRLEALLQSIKNMRVALDAFYGSLSDEQKARFNRIGDEIGRRRI
jgi:hypothetical protein